MPKKFVLVPLKIFVRYTHHTKNGHRSQVKFWEDLREPTASGTLTFLDPPSSVLQNYGNDGNHPERAMLLMLPNGDRNDNRMDNISSRFGEAQSGE
jgi:hypothetical protein